jgi:Family of unknown function (DUF6011)
VSVLASDKQVAFINSLLGERVFSGEVDFANLTSKMASDLIEQLLHAPRQVSTLSVGMYRTPDGEIYRVQASRETGRLYAKHLDLINGFEYEAGAIYKITAGDRMTLEQAKLFGVETGFCCVCGILLTDPKSVLAGIGPVCAKRV